MTGQIDEAAKKRRSLELLGLAAELRAAFAEAQVGRTTRVLFETRLPDGRWSGHAENHVVVAVAAGEGQLENAIGLVRIDAVDPEQADRLMGSIIELDRPNRRLRPALPTLTASAAVGP
jgi:tRNA A37 methylthiotransferase MiaB